jgi:hypothetical protein
VLGYYRQMPEAVELRLHDTALYNSVYRFDDEMLVNVHAYGILAAYTPVMHLRQVDGAFFSHRRTGGTGRRACRWITPIPSAAVVDQALRAHAPLPGGEGRRP